MNDAKIVHVSTRRYSLVFRRILEGYSTNVEVRVDWRTYSGNEVAQLIDQWCVNARIKQTIDFRLFREGVELFSFDDHPDQLFAAPSEVPFLEHLASERIIRYSIVDKALMRPGWKDKSCLLSLVIGLVILALLAFIASFIR